jgi:hypothetical protein
MSATLDTDAQEKRHKKRILLRGEITVYPCPIDHRRNQIHLDRTLSDLPSCLQLLHGWTPVSRSTDLMLDIDVSRGFDYRIFSGNVKDVEDIITYCLSNSNSCLT